MAPAPFNLELIRTRAADIRREAELLRTYAAWSEDAFVSDAERTRARYGLIVVVEAAAAICMHLCARLGEALDSYPGCFERLAAVGVLEGGLAARLAAMARLRNLLVHADGPVDDRRVHRALREGLGDLDAFLAAVCGHLQAQGEVGL